MDVFFSADDRQEYLELLSQWASKHALDFLAWCLMRELVEGGLVIEKGSFLDVKAAHATELVLCRDGLAMPAVDYAAEWQSSSLWRWAQ